MTLLATLGVPLSLVRWHGEACTIRAVGGDVRGIRKPPAMKPPTIQVRLAAKPKKRRARRTLLDRCIDDIGRPPTHTSRVLARLASGPATTGELAAMLGKLSNKGPGMVLVELRNAGKIIGKPTPRLSAQGGPKTTTRWELSTQQSAGEP